MKNRTHILKAWPQYFHRASIGSKTFELRKNDRDYQVGDYLLLQEFIPEDQHFTGVELLVMVTYILHGGQFGIEPGYCVMSITPTP